jgi:hypothetical protein
MGGARLLLLRAPQTHLQQSLSPTTRITGLFYRKDPMVARAVPGYPEALKHLRNTHRERVPGRTQGPALFPPPKQETNQRLF